MMGERKKVDSFQLSLLWTRAQSSWLCINSNTIYLKGSFPYQLFMVQSEPQKPHENSGPENPGMGVVQTEVGKG